MKLLYILRGAVLGFLAAINEPVGRKELAETVALPPPQVIHGVILGPPPAFQHDRLE